jgi:hypothetical protein
MNNKWNKIENVKLKNGSYYELCFWIQPSVYEDGSRMEGDFKHQGIVKYNDGFLDATGFDIKPTPSHVREIQLTKPSRSQI